MEESFGIIPVTRRGKSWQVFLVQLIAGHWGFPKGHANPGETPFDTAKRELFEETGLKVEKLLSPDILEEFYLVNQSRQKRVQYYLCLIQNPLEISIDKNEILEGKWIDIESAPQVLTFEEGRKLCRKAANILSMGG